LTSVCAFSGTHRH